MAWRTDSHCRLLVFSSLVLSSSPAATRRRSGPHYPAPRSVVNGLRRVARARALTRLRRVAPTPPQLRGKLVLKPRAAWREARRFPHRGIARCRLRPGTLRFLASSQEWREHRRAVLGDAESIPVRLLNGRGGGRSRPPQRTEAARHSQLMVRIPGVRRACRGVAVLRRPVAASLREERASNWFPSEYPVSDTQHPTYQVAGPCKGVGPCRSCEGQTATARHPQSSSCFLSPSLSIA